VRWLRSEICPGRPSRCSTPTCFICCHETGTALDSGRVLEAAAEAARVSLSAIADEVEINPVLPTGCESAAPRPIVALSSSRADRDLPYLGEDEARERRLEDEQTPSSTA
jgi:hypothetical protein